MNSPDALDEDDLQVSRRDAPAKKLAQALDMMETGIRLKRAALAHAHPEATAEELNRAMLRWLCADG